MAGGSAALERPDVGRVVAVDLRYRDDLGGAAQQPERAIAAVEERGDCVCVQRIACVGAGLHAEQSTPPVARPKATASTAVSTTSPQ